MQNFALSTNDASVNRSEKQMPVFLNQSFSTIVCVLKIGHSCDGVLKDRHGAGRIITVAERFDCPCVLNKLSSMVSGWEEH